MARSDRQIVVRISLVLAGSMVFLAGAMFFVKRHLPSDQLLVHRLYFTVAEDAPITEEQWRRFGCRQQDYLLGQARQIMPLMAEFIEVTFDDHQPIISLKLRCPGIHSSILINENIDKLLGVYAAHRAEIEPVFFADSNDPAFTLLRPDNIEKLKQYTELHAQFQEQLTDLQNRHRRLTVETLELTQSLKRGIIQTVTGPLADFIRPQLEQAYRADAQVKQMLGRLRELQKKIAHLDFETVRTDSEQIIDSLARQSKNLSEQSLLLQRHISQRRAQLAEEIKQRRWPLYEVDAGDKIAHNQQLLQQYAAEQITLEQRIEQTLDIIITIDSTRGPDYAPVDLALVADAALDTRLHLSNLYDYRSRLYPFSRLQKFLMTVGALIGLLVGLIIPAGAQTVRMT